MLGIPPIELRFDSVRHVSFELLKHERSQECVLVFWEEVRKKLSSSTSMLLEWSKFLVLPMLRMVLTRLSRRVMYSDTSRPQLRMAGLLLRSKM